MEREERKQPMASVEVEIGTRDLLIRTLQEMGCPVTIDKNQNIEFAYQGQHFIAQATNEYHTITVHYPWWGQCSLYDVEQFSLLKNVINEANMRCRVATFHTISDEGDVVGVHSRREFVFIPQIPRITDYTHAMLNEFFHARHFVDGELERLKNANK